MNSSPFMKVNRKSTGEKGVLSLIAVSELPHKADNVLLRELKAQMKKMAQAVKNSLPAIAEAMETLRANMIVFRY